MVWIKETKKQGEVSKNKTLRLPFRRLQRRGEGAKVRQRRAPSWRPSATPGAGRTVPGLSRRPVLASGRTRPAVLLGVP